MSRLGDIALGAAPVAGGAMLGTLVGTFKGPDLRTALKSDIELLKSLPQESVELRAELQRTIDMRVYELVGLVDRNFELRQTAGSYKGNWRDVVLFVCALLFTVVWWNVPHTRSNWLITFVVLVIASVVIGLYAARGMIAALRRMFSRSG
ncbi:MAG: hypothetical protein KIH64_002430 [Mycobacterium sp.]|nr:hypothetical protein [Mycobacterium sp.]